MSDTQRKTIEIYQRLNSANAMVHSYRAAMKLGIFETLCEGQLTATQIAEKLSLASEPVALLLDQLCETGFVEKYADDYAMSVLGKMLPKQFAQLGEDYWSHLLDWVKTGERPVDKGSLIDSTDFGIESIALEWMGTPNALDLIEVMNVGKSRLGMHVVDLSCGSGIFGAAMAYQDKDLKITFVDTAENLERAKSTAESIEVMDRSRFVTADPVSFVSQNPFDLVVIANRCSKMSDEQVASMFRSVAKNLKKTGELAVVDHFSEQKDAFVNRTKAIELQLRTSDGKLRSKKEMTEILYANGFCDAMYSNLKSPPGTHGVLVAGKIT